MEQRDGLPSIPASLAVLSHGQVGVLYAPCTSSIVLEVNLGHSIHKYFKVFS